MFKARMMTMAVLLLTGSLLAQGAQMKLTSSAFQEGGSIPSLYTCDGKDISPPLSWSGAPAETKSFAFIADDPDAPRSTWVHWVLWNLPATANELKEALPAIPHLPSGALQGKNDSGDSGYGGPCPPSGTHRYFFKLYALDTTLSLKSGATKSQLEAAMKDHVLGQPTLMGVYSRT
jgi:Raf kinase inhibitor-like YbhB/YbcL family protein